MSGETKNNANSSNNNHNIKNNNNNNNNNNGFTLSADFTQEVHKTTGPEPSWPPGLRLAAYLIPFQFKMTSRRRDWHRWLVLVLTFVAYASFHMGRRPLSVVKNVLNRNCSSEESAHLSASTRNGSTADEVLVGPLWVSDGCGWAPFDDDATGDRLLALLDSAFLASYALSMFVSGFIGERMNLRHFVTIGSVGSGLGLLVFGLARPLDIHSMSFFVLVQVISGAFQSSGWPAVVTCVGNWFEPGRRGLVYGLWNAHTNLGNIVGATLAGYYVDRDWAISFAVPGLVMLSVGLLLYLFLAPTPADVGLASSSPSSGENPPQLSQKNQAHLASHEEAVSFWRAFAIPGVVEYSMCLFFSKLVNYTFLYWLPRYITASSATTSEESAYLSTPFDVGGAAGAIFAGLLADRLGSANALVCQLMLLLAIPAMIAYERLGTLSHLHNILLQLLVGSLVNGPYCLITTSVSADLGSRLDSGRAMATVAAIIDGMGSLGAVVGPLVAGFITTSGDWSDVFLMLILSGLMSSICLLRLTIQELKVKLGGTAKTYDFRSTASNS